MCIRDSNPIVRPAAGAILFAGSANVITDIHPILALGAGLLVGGGRRGRPALAVRFRFRRRGRGQRRLWRYVTGLATAGSSDGTSRPSRG